MYRCLLFALALTLAFPALAELEFHQRAVWIANSSYDLDDDGVPSCGDRVALTAIYTMEFPPPSPDLTDLRVTLPYPTAQLDLIPELVSMQASAGSTCTLSSGDSAGDVQAVVECDFLCTVGPTCSQNGGTVTAWFTIRDPNPSSSFSFHASLDSNETGLVFARDLNASSSTPVIQPTVFDFSPCPVSAPPELSVFLSDALAVDSDGDGLVDPGDTVRYTVDLLVSGTSAATDVRFHVDPPAHASLVVGSVSHPTVESGNSPGDTSVVAFLGSLNPGARRIFTYDVVVDDPLALGVDQLVSQGRTTAGNVTDRLSDDPETVGRGPDPTITPLDLDPDLAIVKLADPAAVAAGAIATFPLTIENPGLRAAAGVVVTETVPPHTRFAAASSSPGWSCADDAPAGSVCTLALGSLAARASVARTFAVRVLDALPAAAATTTNVASVADDGSQGPDPTPADNSDSATVTLLADPAVSVVKTGPPVAAPGDLVTYQITYVNDGTREATGVVLTETVPAHTTFVASASTPGWTCADGASAGSVCTLSRASLPADGVARTLAFAVRVDATVPAGAETLDNRVEVTHDDPPDDPPGDDEETPVDAEPILAVTKSGPASVTPGSLLTYDLAVVNTGDQDAANVLLEETVPPLTAFVAASSAAGWTCPDGAQAGTVCTFGLGTVAAGAPARHVDFAVRLAASIPAGVESIRNAVVLRTGGPDEPGDEVTTDVDAAPDLVLDKADGDAVVTPGGLVLYTFSVVNAGDQGALDVSVVDTLPPEAAFEPTASTPGWVCAVDATPVTCSFDLGDLAAGASGPDLVLALRLDPAVSFDVDEIVDVATVIASTSEDANTDDNTDTETTPVERAEGPGPELAVLAATLADAIVDDSDADGALDAGETLSYVALVTNRGPAAADNVILSLPPDVHSEIVGNPTTTHGTVQILGSGDDLVRAALGDLAVDETATVTFEIRLLEPVPPSLAELVVHGAATLDNGPTAVTDDPDTIEPLDPTRTPVDASTGVAPHAVPTASTLGLALLAVFLGLAAYRRLRLVPQEVS